MVFNDQLALQKSWSLSALGSWLFSNSRRALALPDFRALRGVSSALGEDLKDNDLRTCPP
jgi:hypothetical protein